MLQKMMLLIQIRVVGGQWYTNLINKKNLFVRLSKVSNIFLVATVHNNDITKSAVGNSVGKHTFSNMKA